MLNQQFEALEGKLSAIQKARKQYDAEAIKQAGAILHIDYDGALEIYRGLVRRTVQTEAAADDADTRAVTKPKEKPVHSEKLVRRLLAHRTAAPQVELAAQPDLALAVVVSRLAYSILRPCRNAQVVQVKAETFEHALLGQADDLEPSPAWKALEALRKIWEEQLPMSEEEGLKWLLEPPQETQLNLLAVCVAFTVNRGQSQEGNNPMDRLAEAVGLDMTKWWKPTRTRYFDQVTKVRIQQVWLEALPKESVANVNGMKKNVAAETAERLLAETHWLPSILRGNSKD